MGITVHEDKLITTQKHIYQLTGVRVSVYDPSFRLISYYPPPVQHTPICRIIRSCKEGFRRCNISDVCGMNSAKDRRAPVTYCCHAGLVESVMPVVSDGHVLCYILLGQYLDGEASIENQVRNIIEKTSDFTDLSALDDTIRCLPKLTSIQRDAAFSLMSEIILGRQIVKKESDAIIERAEAYIVSHIEDDGINITTLCNYLNLPAQRIRSCFASSTGMTVGNYITALKIEKAQELLYSTDMPISEIASAVGIPDFNYFSRVFKKKVGSTPLAFRKNNTGELSVQLSKYESNNDLMREYERLSSVPTPHPLDGSENSLLVLTQQNQ